METVAKHIVLKIIKVVQLDVQIARLDDGLDCIDEGAGVNDGFD